MIYDHAVIGSGFSGYSVVSLLKGKSKVCVISPASYRFAKDGYHRNKGLEFNRPFNKQYQSFMKSIWHIGANRIVDRLSLNGSSSLWGGTVDLEKDCRLFSRLEEIKILNLNRDLPGLKCNRELGVMVGRDGRIFETWKGFFSTYKDFVDGYVETIQKSDAGHLELKVTDGSSESTIKAHKVVICTSVPQLIQLLISSNLVPDEFKFSLNDHRMTFTTYKSVVDPRDCKVSYKPMVGLSRKLGLRVLYFPGFGIGPYVVDQTFTANDEKMEYVVKGKEPAVITTTNPESDFGKSIHYYGLTINDVPVTRYLSTVSENIFNVGHSTVLPDKPGPLTNYLLECAAQLA